MKNEPKKTDLTSGAVDLVGATEAAAQALEGMADVLREYAAAWMRRDAESWARKEAQIAAALGECRGRADECRRILATSQDMQLREDNVATAQACDPLDQGKAAEPCAGVLDQGKANMLMAGLLRLLSRKLSGPGGEVISVVNPTFVTSTEMVTVWHEVFGWMKPRMVWRAVRTGLLAGRLRELKAARTRKANGFEVSVKAINRFFSESRKAIHNKHLQI